MPTKLYTPVLMSRLSNTTLVEYLSCMCVINEAINCHTDSVYCQNVLSQIVKTVING